MSIASDQKSNQSTDYPLDAALQRWLPTPLRPIADLFLLGHAPLSFVVGQTLLILSPMAALAGWSTCYDWAMHLSDKKRT